PDARLDDGLFDYLHAGCLSRWEILRFLPRVALSGPPKDHPKVRLGRCRELRIRSEAPMTVHIDGEFFALPEDRLRELEIRLLPRGLRAQTAWYPAPGPSQRRLPWTYPDRRSSPGTPGCGPCRRP